MQSIVLMKKTKELEGLSKQFGFSKTLDVVLIKAKTKNELSRKVKQAAGKVTLYKPPTEELLRFALERTAVDVVYGMEEINYKDSVHFVRGGLDQVTCKIAAKNGKIIAFSFSDILHSSSRSRLLARMMLSIKLCRKYKVKMLFSTFATSKHELRGVKDLHSFWHVLGGNKEDLSQVKGEN